MTSAAFKFLCKDELTDQDAKGFASKNIMLNINSIIKGTTKGIKEVDEVNMKLKNEGKVREILRRENLK